MIRPSHPHKTLNLSPEYLMGFPGQTHHADAVSFPLLGKSELWVRCFPSKAVVCLYCIAAINLNPEYT